MDYEQKYNDMVQRARELHEAGNFLTKKQMEIVCPELAESEDERVRKALLEVVSGIDGGWPFEKHRITKKEAIAYLEKQKEQKPIKKDHITPNEDFFQWIYDRLVFVHKENPNVDYMRSLKERIEEIGKEPEWSEEDEKMINTLISYVEDPSCWNLKCPREKLVAFIESLPKRFSPQPEVEWSEEDEKNLELVVDCIYEFYPDPVMKYKLKDWLKSLRPQPKQEWTEEDEEKLRRLCWIVLNISVKGLITEEEETELCKWMDKWLNHNPVSRWKPSEQQMEALRKSIEKMALPCGNRELTTLYEQLKKL